MSENGIPTSQTHGQTQVWDLCMKKLQNYRQIMSPDYKDPSLKLHVKGFNALPAIKPTVSKHWMGLKALVPTMEDHLLASSFLQLLPDTWKKWQNTKHQRHYIIYIYLTLLIGRQEEHLACKKFEWCGTGMVICLQWGVDDLHMVQLMSLPPIISCFIKIQSPLMELLLLLLLLLLLHFCYYYNDSHLTASFPGLAGYAGNRKAEPFWILQKQEMMRWQWHQLNHMQNICTSFQTDNHTSTSSFNFFTNQMLFLPPNQQYQSIESSQEI